MNPKRKEKEKQVLHLPYVSANEKFCSDSYNNIMSKLCGPPVYAYTCTFWYSNFFLCCEDFETLKILPSLPSIATIIEGNK